MTKNDYIIIADALAAGARKAMQMKVSLERVGVIHEAYVKTISMALAHDNPKFSRERFEQYISQRI